MISNPPMISPQRILLSSINELSTSVKDFRGSRGGVSCLGSAWKVGDELACCGVDKNEGTGSITISSSLAISDAVTTEDGGTLVDGIEWTTSSVTDTGLSLGRQVL